MTEAERKILYALAWMCEQYIRDDRNAPIHDHNARLDHMCMHAGEWAVEVLVQYGLVKPEFRGGLWTEAGKELLNSENDRQKEMMDRLLSMPRPGST